MSAFITGLLGAVTGLVVLILIAYIWLKHKLKRFAKELGSAFSGGGVPPFRVTLDATGDPTWRDDAAISAVSDALTAAGYRAAGDFLIDEMPGVVLRGFANPSTATLAALFEHPQLLEPQLDILRLHHDRQHVLATTTDDDGLDAPPNKIVHRFDASLAENDELQATISAMQAKVLAEGKDREPIPVGAKLFATVFATAYATEMDWRIQRGGVTAEEVRRVAIMGGQDSPGDQDIEIVRSMWRSAIDEFISEAAQHAFLAAGTVSATDWEQLRERILVVHEHSPVGELVGSLADDLLEDDEDEDDAYEAGHEELVATMRSHFDDADPVSGFQAARSALPALAGFEHLGDVAKPWRAAIYARPSEAA